MSLSIRIICSPDGESISEWTKLFPANGGEIGRDFGSTMPLSDSSRTISSTHAIIRKSNRGYQILDNSTNGLFINGSDKALGKGNQTALNDGDVLSIGRYRLLVSCFLPAEVKAPSSAEEQNTQSSLGADPFAATETMGSMAQEEGSLEPQFDFSSSVQEVVEEDPFLTGSERTTKETKVFSTSFAEVDEDPLKETSLNFNLPDFQKERVEPTLTEAASKNAADLEADLFVENQRQILPNKNDIKYSIGQYKSMEDRFNQYAEQALDYALTKILNEMSPENIEAMFTDFVPTSFWSKKRDFWGMYKRYFERQMKNKDWQIKFHAYFQEGIRLQRNLEEKS